MTENHQGRFHASHVQTAPLNRRVLQYSKIKNFLRSLDQKEELLLVFSVTPFKIDQNKNQNRSIDKVQDLGNERRYIILRPSPRFRSEEYFVYEISVEMFSLNL